MSSETTRIMPRQFKTERAGDRKPFRPKAWSHQQELTSLKGKLIDIVYRGQREPATVRLLEADQFALKVEITHHKRERTERGYSVDISAKEHKSVLTVFKHDLTAYGAHEEA